jgi:hypothetical protein
MKTYRWNYGELVLGGGIDVEVTAGSPEEARAKAERALDDLRVCLSESQTLHGVRLSYSASKSEVFLGAPSDQPSTRRARDYSVKSGDEDCMARVAEAAKLAVVEHGDDSCLRFTAVISFAVQVGAENVHGWDREHLEKVLREHCQRHLNDDRWGGVDSWELVEGGGI